MDFLYACSAESVLLTAGITVVPLKRENPVKYGDAN